MDRLWWENITNTSHFIDQIVEAVQSGSHLFLQLPQLSAAGAAVLPFVVIPGIVISVFFRLPELKKGKHISNGVAQKNN